jgi:chromosome segregation ATPase
MARRAVVERDELMETANRLAAEGKPVTALSLKEALGGGSFNTIYKYLGEWEASRPKSAPTGSVEMPESVLNAFMSTWRVASMEAARETAAVKERAAEEVKAAQGKFSEALEAIQKLEAQSEEDAAEIEALKAKVQELEQTVGQLSNDNAAVKATSEQLRHQVKSQQSELDRLHKDMDKERVAYREQMEKLNADHALAQNRAGEQIEKLHKERDALTAKVEHVERERQAAQLKQEQSDKRSQEAEKNRELAVKEREAAIKEAAELRGQSEAMKVQNGQLLAALAERPATDKRKGD